MKKKMFLMSLLSLIITLIFSSCTHELQENETTIELIENNWLVLETGKITQESYNNPQNLFLKDESPAKGENTYNYSWFKKLNNKYELVSINFKKARSYPTNFVYKIKDTVNINESFYTSKNLHNKDIDGSKILAKAYNNPKGELIDREYYNQKYLISYLGTVVETSMKDSLVKYLPEKKSFIFVAANPVTKKRIDLTPWAFILLTLLLIISFVADKKDRHDSLEDVKNIWKKLFWILLILNLFYSSMWFGLNINFPIIVALTIWSLLITGLFYLFFLLARILIGQKCYEKIPKIKKTFWNITATGKRNFVVKINKIYWTLLISIITFVNLYFLFDLSLIFSLFGALIVLSPGMFLFFKLLIKIKFKEKQNENDQILI